jgi:hypothetical protein
MRFPVALLVSLALIASASLFEVEEMPEHHGYRHVDGAAEGHHHGDTDDHHDEPGSPCHHHEAQACGGHGLDFAAGSFLSIDQPTIAGLFRLPVVRPDNPPTLRLILHVPIA